MIRSPNSSVPVLFAAVSVAVVLFRIIAGSDLGLLAVGLSVAAVAGEVDDSMWWPMMITILGAS